MKALIKDANELETWNRRLEGAEAEKIIQWGIDRFGTKMVFGTGLGIDGIVILSLLSKITKEIPIFFLETGKHFQETLDFLKLLEKTFQVQVQRIPPSMTDEEIIKKEGDRLWEKDPDRCCRIRKVFPLQKTLKKYDGWMTGLRRDQSPTRARATVLQHRQIGEEKKDIIKINPLVAWNYKQTWNYIFKHKLPYHPLLDQGYKSIGCEPCTSQVAEGGSERDGRWQGKEKLECGIHHL